MCHKERYDNLRSCYEKQYLSEETKKRYVNRERLLLSQNSKKMLSHFLLIAHQSPISRKNQQSPLTIELFEFKEKISSFSIRCLNRLI